MDVEVVSKRIPIKLVAVITTIKITIRRTIVAIKITIIVTRGGD